MTEGIDIAAFNRQLITEFRESGGQGSLGPVHFEKLMLLTTTGRRSGQPRIVPLGYARDEAGNYVLFASNMGAPRDPQWFGNIVADPRVQAEVTGASWAATAIVPTGAERDAAYRLWIEATPAVADHEKKAGRTIPMVLIPPPAG